MKIGGKLRERRKEQGLSLRELGEKAGVTASFLSQVENDQVSPSLNSLQSIATALGVPMFSLLNDTPGGNVVRVDQRRKFKFEDDQISYDLLTPDFTRDMMAYLRQGDRLQHVGSVDLNDLDRVVIKPGDRTSLLGVCYRKEM